MENGNKVVSSDFLKVLLALKENIMKDIHCSELAIVKSISETECVCSLLSDENKKINAYKMPSLEIEDGDVVQIIFSDSNFRSNLQKYNNQKTLQIVSNDRHSINNGVIIGSFRSKKENTSNLPLGTILTLSVEYDEPSLQKLDGRSLLQDGIYKDFCEWLKQRVNDSNVPICSINDYANEMTTYGQCGKFVINDTSSDLASNGYTVYANSIKLPTITEFIASNNGGDAIGLAELDEFKSHKHNINDYADVGADTNPLAIRFNTNENTKTGYYDVYTNLTGGEETRPKNIRYPYYIVVATTIKTDVQINLENVANDINNINTVLSRTEQVETIYDMYSNDPNINLNKTGGLENGESISKDVSKFKKLICTYKYSTNSAVFIVDLTVIGETYGIGLGGIAYDNYGTNLGFFTGKITVNDVRNLIQVSIFNAFQGGYNDRYGFISKIEGVY